MEISTADINNEIRALLDVLVEDGKGRMTFETKMKIRGYITLGEYEKAIQEMGGQAFLDIYDDKELSGLGELLSVGIMIREGFEIKKHES